ncbi:Calmodulin-binding protein 60 A [Abeliophyllum distichum]|uniref:Calmodulin-binding protein 60 A n=1 Tax=Abeliophyllum distichum TaxID=126358 RepID=A0ABD1VQB5_9LAMI
MSQKRHQEEDAKPRLEGTPFEDKRRRRAPSFRSVVLKVMNLQRLQHLMEPVLEPLIRRVVKEEVDSALTKYGISMKRSHGKDTQHHESRCLQLHFLHDISLPVFTGARIEGEECNTLKVALVDSLTGQVVSSGPECSAKVEIVVLEGDFDGDEGDNWTHEEFKNNIVRAREGKKPLLTGDVLLTIKDGIGLVGNISFTDNSSWTRSRKFRLGAKVVDIDGIRIREARSESFIVRDQRGELYKKHHPPFLFDEVWRLEKIGKDGAFHKRLSKERVNTVKDFLILLFLDPTRLRNIIGTGMSTKMWEVTVEHAQTCVLDKNLHLYNPSGSEQKIGVVFDVVGQVTALFSDGRYIPGDKLSETEKADARNLVISAYRDWEKVVTFDDEASLMDVAPYLSIARSSSNLQLEGSCNGNKVSSSQKFDRYSYLQQNTSSLDNMQSLYSIGSLSNLDECFHSVDPVNIMFEQPSGFPVQVANNSLCNADSMSQAFCADEQLQYFDTGCSLEGSNMQSSADLQSVVSCFLPRPEVSIDKAQRRWKILFSVFKMIFIKKNCGKK